MAKTTLLLALLLGTLSGVSQIAVDLDQEKDAVEYAAEEFLSSVAPSAASAAYNFYLPAAERVVDGLFTQRAIAAVTIINEGEVMIAQERAIEPTLPNLGRISRQDLMTLERPLFAPEGVGDGGQIGLISVVIDRSVVAPAFVNRLASYFFFATAKNFLLGILLIWIVYSSLARHIIGLAATAAKWSPNGPPLHIEPTPKLLQRTELDTLSAQIKHLAETATGQIQQAEASRAVAERSNSELTEKSELLSKEVHEQNVQLQQANTRLRQLAEIDALTGLYNRRSFDRFAAAAFEEKYASSPELAIAMIDVDFFKPYNDYYGHQAGDRCLERLAEVITSSFEDDTILVARYGGEEFVVMFEGHASEDVEVKVRALHQNVAKAKLEHQRSTVADQVTISVGLAFASPAGEDACQGLDKTISSADEALYEAKANGRNRTVTSSQELRDRVRRARNDALQILKAVDARAFEPFYQPQFDAHTGALVGVEALVRRKLDDGSFSAPASFLETAQAHGYLPHIDRIVLEQVTEFIAQATAQNITIPRIAVNAPRENLFERSYVDGLVQLAQTSETQVVVELLETVIFDEPDDVLTWQLDMLQQEGIDIEIDDFGTGHTSIISLMKLRPSRIKIAKELVIPMEEQAILERVVASVIQMSEALEIGVLAEGVETQKISARLIHMGCPVQQGYFFARPMQAADFLNRYGANADMAPGQPVRKGRAT